jgi:hypothetical protein
MPFTDPESTLEQQKRAFAESTPRAPKQLCQFLGGMQEFSPDQRLFEDAETELALWAHARAYRSGSEESETSLPVGMQQLGPLIAPLAPTQLEWGAVSHFQDKVIAALDSPIIHVWLFSEEAAPGAKKKPVRLALIVGRGIQPVRERVINAALSCLLTVDPHPNNLILEGLIQIHVAPIDGEAEDIGERTWTDVIIGSIFGSKSHNEVVISENASEAMEKLEGTLTQLEARTGFVSVHRASFRDYMGFNRRIESEIRKAQRRDAVSLWSGQNSEIEVAMCRPINRTDAGRAFQLHLNAELLDSALYTSLRDSCRAALIEPILGDMERRRRFYEDQLEQHRNKYNWFQKLSDKEKDAEPDVIADREINWQMGQEILLSEPIRINARQYYTKDMLFKIEQDQKHLQYVERIHKRMLQLRDHPDAPIDSLIAARLFDAAIRDITPSDNPDIAEQFTCWKKLVQPMLWLEWRWALERDGVAEPDLFTRHTVFNVRIEKADSALIITPFTLIDSVRSVLVFDAHRRILVTRDATDYVEVIPSQPEVQGADRLYVEAQTLAEEGASQQDVQTRLMAALYAAPARISRRIVNEWLEHFPVRDEEFERIRKDALANNRPVIGAINALRWCNELCYFSASETVASALGGGPHSVVHASALLMRAYVKCLKSGYPWDTLAGLLTGSRAVPELQDAAADLLEANRLCPDVVRTFVLQRVLAPRLFLPAEFTRMTPGEEGALAAEKAVEEANLSAEFDDALTSLAPTKESQRSAYSKLMPPIESCFAKDFVPPPTGLNPLIELLTGKKRGTSAN